MRPEELAPSECATLISEGGVGRVAMCTPMGPQIFPVNFVVQDDAILFRTAPYSTLGTYSRGTDIAFEVDHLEPAMKQGWSVVAVGRAEVLQDSEEIAEVRRRGEPEPWAEGQRRLYVRLRWRQITGRRLVGHWLDSSYPGYREPRL